MNPEPITLRGLLFPRLSYGRHLLRVAETLHRLNIDFRICPTGKARPDDDALDMTMECLRGKIDLEGKVEGPEILIAPPETRPHSVNTVFWTMHESFQLTERQSESIRKATHILTPSEWCLRNLTNAVSQYPLPPRVSRVPLGIDPTIYYPRVNNRAYDIRFLAGGHYTGTGKRKRLEYLVDVWRNAFPIDDTKDQVSLTVKVTPESDVEELEQHIGDDPRILLNRDFLTDTQMAELYRDADCFINCSYGEGFGLMLLEAMACGTPVVSTAFTGPKDFLDSSWSYIVEGKTINSTDPDQYPGKVETPKFWPLLRELRTVCYLPKERYHKAGLSAKIASQYTWLDSTLTALSMMESTERFPSIKYND